MNTLSITAVMALAFASGVFADRSMTVTNNCAYTIWPGMFTDLNAGTAVPSQTTGWEQAAGTTVQFTVPDNWTAGRIWGRTNCDFSTNPGPNSCETGGCNGGLVCDPSTGTGVPPATVAEFTLSPSDLADNYDVSLVDGFNIPMSITPSAGSCGTASCPVDLNAACPSDIADVDSAGMIVGCRSACQAGLSSDPANSPYCCTGDHNTAATCPPAGVLHYDYFKGNCPDAYAYAYDESSGTALWTCFSSLAADYTITFCP